MLLISNHTFKRLILIISILLLTVIFVVLFQKTTILSEVNLQIEDMIDLNKQRLGYQFVPVKLNVSNSKEFLQQALPVLGSDQHQKPLSKLINDPLSLINLISEFLVDVKINDPINIFNSGLPLALAAPDPKKDSIRTTASELFSQQDKKQQTKEQKLSDKKRQASKKSDLIFSQTEQSEKVKEFYDNKLVAVYHTHTSESYGVSVFNGHSSPGTRGDIVEVGNELVQRLKIKHGIKAVQSTQVNDAVYRRAYFRSRNVGKELVRQNSDLKMIFDIHRDALAKKDKEVITTTINGKRVAKVMILVARAGPDYKLSHPNWKKNLKFARKLADKMNAMYPGLLRKGEVKIVDNRRYNQDIHPQALLLEFGGVSNTLTEAKRSARLVGDVVASLLAEEVN